jgi:hypothetical protein
VTFRDPNGTYLETGTTTVARNYWGIGVRAIDEEALAKILTLGLGADSEAQLFSKE